MVFESLSDLCIHFYTSNGMSIQNYYAPFDVIPNTFLFNKIPLICHSESYYHLVISIQFVCYCAVLICSNTAQFTILLFRT